MADAAQVKLGDRVELVERIYSYEPGSVGVVSALGASGALLVQFDETGTSVFVEPNGLRRVEERDIEP